LNEGWSTQQLAEFLAQVSSYDDERAAVRGAVESASETLDAEVGAVVRAERLLAVTGFPEGAAPAPLLLELAAGRQATAELPGIGPCHVVRAGLVDETPGQLLLARSGDAFEQHEVDLVRGMGRVLTFTLELLRALAKERALRERSQEQARENAALLSSLRERQALLARLAGIQGAIAHRATLDDVLDMILAGVGEFVDAEVATLRLDGGERTSGRAGGEHATRAAELAMQREELVIAEAAMAAPVVLNGSVVGALAVSARGRDWSAAERGVLLAFAENASLALTDAENFGTAVHRSLHDMLTGLPNRALLLDRVEQAAGRATRSGDGPAVLFLDVDDFKRVNEAYGHGVGDAVLVEVAERLRGCLRPGDTAARFGGDEFALLLDDLGSDELTLVADRVMAAVSRPFRAGGQDIDLSISLGIAMGEDDLLRSADLAMYHAKSSGRGQYELFDPAMHTALTERMALESDLAQAVDRGEIEVHYQPIVNLRTGAVAALEALVRWRHPQRGLLAPDEFIGAAEETGLIHAIGRLVLERATGSCAAWQGAAPLAVTVNLSVVQLEHPGLVDEVRDVLAQARLDPERLILEITETLLMHDREGAALGRLKDLGVQIAVDDFGTGYSSLQYLRSLPIDILKIAKPFVDDLADENDLAVAQAIVDVGHGLGLRVIAEGVERGDQVAQLVELGCEWGQGFHFARPQALADAEATLRARTVTGWPARDARRGRRRSRVTLLGG
jgi:diguanylate cyclase (GGDEF)-like protein